MTVIPAANWFRQGWRLDELGVHGDERQDGLEIGGRMFGPQDPAYALILVQDLRTED
jgi:hypothetical protein